MARTPDGLIAVVDIGKSNAKLTLTEAQGGRVVWARERPNVPVPYGPVRDLGAVATWDWLQQCLGEAPDRDRIGFIVPVAHGAAVALLDADGELICAPDYEDPVFDAVADAYNALRDPFAETLSPEAPHGLNVGRQLYFLQTCEPALFGKVRHIVPYAQYWAWRLCGVLASEATTLGAHTDLWLPAQRGFSALAIRQGWAAMIPQRRAAGDRLGAIRPGLAERLGLDPGCLVVCGIHDSNASYLCHRAARGDAPFAVVSSGTWAIVMANGTRLARLREDLDMLANVDAFDAPVGTARFMGGREYAAIAGPQPSPPAIAAVGGLLDARTMALPTFALAGPFRGQAGRLIGAADLDGVGLASLASLYVALVTDVMLDLLDVRGDVIVDGPLAQNSVYTSILAALRPQPVQTSMARAGTLAGARRLVHGDAEPPPTLRRVSPAELPALPSYRAEWRDRVASPS